MAKLSSRGRTVVAEAVKTVVAADGTAHTYVRRLMSDGKVLMGSKPSHGWKVSLFQRDRGETDGEWCVRLRAAGWAVTGNRVAGPENRSGQ